MSGPNPRAAAVSALVRQEQDGFSNLVLDAELKRQKLEGRDKAFASAIFYTVLEHRGTLDYILAQFLPKGLAKLDAPVREILRSALAQARYMQVPVSAAVNEAVKLTRAFKKSSASGLVNAVLRRACVYDLSKARFQNETERLMVLGSAGKDVAEFLRSRYPDGLGLGLRRTQRLALECIAAALVLGLLALNGCLPTGLILPGAGYVECALAPLLWAVLLVAMAEAARVADGADGTVCGAAFVAMLGLMMLETQLGWFPLAVFPAALAGALMAFLLWDFPPAKLHPGRCGCLYAAGAIGCIPLCIGYAELSIPLALPFWVEGGMVLLQVLFCRWKGRPLFAAAPLHRWLEKRGMSAVNIFYSLCALSVCGLALAVRLARWA